MEGIYVDPQAGLE